MLLDFRALRLGCRALLPLLWLAQSSCEGNHAARTDAGFRAGANAEHGAQLIRERGCGRCHRVPGVRGADGWVGPPLDAFSRRSFISGQMPNTPENLARWIRDPQSIDPKTAMPRVALDDRQARDIAAYLFDLR